MTPLVLVSLLWSIVDVSDDFGFFAHCAHPRRTVNRSAQQMTPAAGHLKRSRGWERSCPDPDRLIQRCVAAKSGSFSAT